MNNQFITLTRKDGKTIRANTSHIVRYGYNSVTVNEAIFCSGEDQLDDNMTMVVFDNKEAIRVKETTEEIDAMMAFNIYL